jgi:hypothetical protein
MLYSLKDSIATLAREEPSRDAEVERRLRRQLAGCHVPGASRFTIQAKDNHVAIQGTVRSYYFKQLCLNACRQAAGDHRIVDQLTVAE